MHLYLSSFRLGNQAGELQRLAEGRVLGFIPNALDFLPADARRDSNATELERVRNLGLRVEPLDLTEYFGRPELLDQTLARLQGVWVRGGNTFVLRQAMHRSGFDQALRARAADDFLYAGYSAGVCVLAPRLDGLAQVDDPSVEAYPGTKVLWEGLGILDYLILPHYRSDHPESPAIEREVEYCTRNGIAFRPMRDGDVLILEDFLPSFHRTRSADATAPAS